MYRLLSPQAGSLESAALQQEVTALRELQIEVAATLQQQLKLPQGYLSPLLALTAAASHCVCVPLCQSLSLWLPVTVSASASHRFYLSLLLLLSDREAGQAAPTNSSPANVPAACLPFVAQYDEHGSLAAKSTLAHAGEWDRNSQ